MHFTSLTIITLLLTLAHALPTTQAPPLRRSLTPRQAGSLTVTNSCGTSFFSSTDGGSTFQTFSSGQSLNVPYSTSVVKIDNDGAGDDAVLQIETADQDGRVYYDISIVNGEPSGLTSITLSSSDPSCGAMSCQAPECDNYNNPPSSTENCEDGASLTAVLCG